MPHDWAYKTVFGLAEVQEAAMRLDVLMSDIASDAQNVMTFPESSSLPELHVSRLQGATLRATELRNRISHLLSEMGRLLIISVIMTPKVADQYRHMPGKPLIREFTTNDTLHFVEELLGLYRKAIGIGAAFAIASEALLEYVDLLDAAEGIESPDDEEQTPGEKKITITREIEEEDLDLTTAVDGFDRTSHETIEQLREMNAALREVLVSLNDQRQLAVR